MQIIHVPADVVTILRSALLGQLDDPIAKLDDTRLLYERAKHPELFLAALQELDAYRAAIDEIGWSQPARQRPAIIDLDAHRGPILTALHTQLDVERDFMGEELKARGARKQRRTARRNARIIERFLRENGLPICTPPETGRRGIGMAARHLSGPLGVFPGLRRAR